jgi:hypothetical protein
VTVAEISWVAAWCWICSTRFLRTYSIPRLKVFSPAKLWRKSGVRRRWSLSLVALAAAVLVEGVVGGIGDGLVGGWKGRLLAALADAGGWVVIHFV